MAKTQGIDELIASSAALRPIPPEASEAYSAELPRLVLEVNARISAHPRYRDWLAGNAPQLLADNHRHHAMFMDEIFSWGHFDLLAATLPWVYRAYHARGVGYDYFEAELAYWQQAVVERLSADAAAPINAVYDWMLSRHQAVIALAEAHEAAPQEGVDPAFAKLFDALEAAARSFDDARILELCRGARDAGMGLPELLQGLVYPLMLKVGVLWERAEITVADEHEITAIMNRVLASLYFDQPFPDAKRGRALVASSANEFHEMGAWTVATCLELDGWDVDYLGANVPGDELLAKAREVKPSLIALSVAMPFNLGPTRDTIATIRAQLPGTRVMIGGQVFQLLPRLADGMGADACLSDCQAAMQWARGCSIEP
jgi:methanogenic corrinoid protein MtbC1